MRDIALELVHMRMAYHDWQVQKDTVTVTETMKHSLASVVGRPVKCAGAGRTDTDVYAETYIANFRTSSRVPYGRTPLAVNTRLPDDIVVVKATEVSDGFNAIGSCLKKEYAYHVYSSHIRNAFYINHTWFYLKHLGKAVIQHMTSHFVSTHDFVVARSVGTETHTTMRTVHYFDISRSRGLIECRMCADGFLYNMVCAMVGTCIYAADDRFSPDNVPAILEGRDRTAAEPTVPAGGLHMTKL